MAYFYSRGETDASLLNTPRKRPRTGCECRSSTCGSSCSEGTIEFTPIQYLQDAPRLNVEQFKQHLETELQRANQLFTNQPPQLPIVASRRRRSRKRPLPQLPLNQTLLAQRISQMEAARQIVVQSEMDESIVLGAMEEDRREALLARSLTHNPYCNGDGCTNAQLARIFCYTCANSYCSGCVRSNQAEDIIVLNSDHASIQQDKRNGGYIFCSECCTTLDSSSVIDVAAIAAQHPYSPQINDRGNKEQSKQLCAPQLNGKDRMIIDGEDLAPQYTAQETDIPESSTRSGPAAVFEVPAKKRVRKEKDDSTRMTGGDGMVCPGCGEDECQLSKESCREQFPVGWGQVLKLRSTLRAFEGIDQKWDFIERQIRFDPLTSQHMHIRYDCMNCPVNTKQERLAQDITCSFCSQVTPAALMECGVPANEVDSLISNITPHEHRGTKVCGELYKAGLTYASLHGKSKKAKFFVPCGPEAAPKKVSKLFLARLYNVPLSTLAYHIKQKRDGKLRNTIEETSAKGGNIGGLSDIKCNRLETELKLIGTCCCCCCCCCVVVVLAHLFIYFFQHNTQVITSQTTNPMIHVTPQEHQWPCFLKTMPCIGTLIFTINAKEWAIGLVWTIQKEDRVTKRIWRTPKPTVLLMWPTKFKTSLIKEVFGEVKLKHWNKKKPH